MNVVHLIDNMKFMAQCKDNQYDLIISDPPYGIGNWIPGNIPKTGVRASKQVKWNDKIPEQTYFNEIERISKNQIIWGANYYNCFNTGGAVVWFKGNINPKFSQCEIASLSFQKKVDYIHINWQSGFYRVRKEGEQIHPCQKPVALYKWLLQNYAKKGDKIFDSHVGSGSSRIACYDMGFDFEGCEIDKDYWEAQEERFKIHTAQGNLFSGADLQRDVAGVQGELL